MTKQEGILTIARLDVPKQIKVQLKAAATIRESAKIFGIVSDCCRKTGPGVNTGGRSQDDKTVQWLHQRQLRRAIPPHRRESLDCVSETIANPFDRELQSGSEEIESCRDCKHAAAPRQRDGGDDCRDRIERGDDVDPP